MSTDRPPLEDLDLSAHLDHEDDGDVAARLQGDPAARERLEQLRFVRDAVAGSEVSGLSDQQVDSLVATALAAGSSEPHGDRGDPDGPDVVPVPISQRRGGVPTWAVAAVVVVLVGIGLTLVWTGRDDGDPDVAFTEIGSSISADSEGSAADSGTDPAASASEMAPELREDQDPASGAANAPTTTAPGVDGSYAPTLVYLGEFTDADALREHLRDGFPTENAGSVPETGVDDLSAAFRCLGKVEGLFSPTGDATDVGLAIVADAPVIVYDLPYRTDEGRDTTLVIAVDEVSCIPVLSFQR